MIGLVMPIFSDVTPKNQHLKNDVAEYQYIQLWDGQKYTSKGDLMTCKANTKVAANI